MVVMNNSLSNQQSREAFFISVYKKAFPAVARYIARRGGNMNEAQDIFQDALVVYYEKMVSQNQEVIENENAYLLGVSKKLWLQYYRLSNKSEPLNDTDIEEENLAETSTGKVLQYLQTAGKKCMELLKACYYDGLKPHSLASRFGYSSEHSATVAKYKCLEKVRETVKQKSLSYADFIE